MGIDTTKPGDVYLLRQAGTPFSQGLKANINVCEYPYESKLFMKNDELENRSAARAKITEHALNYPIIIEDDV